MAVNTYLQEQTCLNTPLPVSEHSPITVPPRSLLSPLIGKWLHGGGGVRPSGSFPTHRIGKRCPGVTCLLVVYLRAGRSQLWATCSIISWAKRGRGTGKPEQQKWQLSHYPFSQALLPTPASCFESHFIFLFDKPWCFPSWRLAYCLFWVNEGSRRRWIGPACSHLENFNHVHLQLVHPNPALLQGSQKEAQLRNPVVFFWSHISSSGIKHMGMVLLSKVHFHF